MLRATREDNNIIPNSDTKLNPNVNNDKGNDFTENIFGYKKVRLCGAKHRTLQAFVTPKGIIKIDKNKMQMLLKLTYRLQTDGVVTPANYSITDNAANFNPNVNNHKGNDFTENIFGYKKVRLCGAKHRTLLAVNELDDKQKLINVIIDYDWLGNKINIIPSAYGREDFDGYIKECIKENKIIYADKKTLASRTRVQFPRGSKNSNSSITDKENIIKSLYEKYYKNKTVFQESGNDYDDMLIAGYTPYEFINKTDSRVRCFVPIYLVYMMSL